MNLAGVTFSSFITFHHFNNKRNPPSVESGILMVTITICADNKFLCYHHSITYCVGWRNIAQT